MNIPVVLPNGARIGDADSVLSAETVFRAYMYDRFGWQFADGRNTTAIVCAAIDETAREIGLDPEIFGAVFEQSEFMLPSGDKISVFMLIR